MRPFTIASSVGCFAEHRSGGNKVGRPVHGLEPVGEGLSVPTVQHHHVNSGQAKVLSTPGPSYSSVATGDVVSPGRRVKTEDGASSCSGTVPDSTGEAVFFASSSKLDAPVDDFLAFALRLRRGISAGNTCFLKEYKSASTQLSV